MNKLNYITLLTLVILLPTLARSQPVYGPTWKNTWRYQIESVPKSKMETTAKRVGDIIFQRLRLCGAEKFSLSSRAMGKISITWKDYKEHYEGMRRIIKAPLLVAFHLAKKETAESALELEAKRQRGDYIFPCQPTNKSKPKVTYRLAEAKALFGTPHLAFAKFAPRDKKPHIKLEFTDLGMQRIKDHWSKWQDKELVVVMAARIHGKPIKFGPLEGNTVTSEELESEDLCRLMGKLILAGCHLPKLRPIQQ